MRTLRGRTVLLTGATGGIGAALVDALVAKGARVIAVARSELPLRRMEERHGRDAVIGIPADAASVNGRQRLMSALRDMSLHPSIMVIGHAISAFGLFEQQSPRDLTRVVETNLLSPLHMIHDFLPVLDRAPSASVVVIGSTFGSIAFPGFAAYSASKFGLRGLVEALSREYADSGIAFQYLSPRATRTSFNSPSVEALNGALATRVDMPGAVASQIVRAMERSDRRMQIGWPEKLLARLNGLLPELVDRSLRPQLAAIRRHSAPATTDQENTRHASYQG